MTVAVAGLGDVGLSMSVLLARRHSVRALDIDAGRALARSLARQPRPGLADVEEKIFTRDIFGAD